MPTAIDRIIGNPLVTQFLANGPTQTELQDNYAMEHLAVRLTGTAVLAGYSAAPSKYVESIENLIQSFGLTATGNSAGAVSAQLTSVDGPILAFKTRLMEGTAPTRTDVGTANGTYNFETNFKNYFVDPRSNASRLTTLFSSTLSSLRLQLQWRDATAMLYGGTGGTVTLSNVQATIQSREYLGVQPPNPSPYVKMSQRKFNITNSSNGFDCTRVPVGNVLRRQYFKGIVGPSDFGDPSDSLFGASGKLEGPHLQLMLNNAVLKLDAVYQQLRVDNKLLFGVESINTGYAVYEPARNRKLAASLPMANVANADNYIDVAFQGGNTNTIQITDEELVGLSAAQFSAKR